MENLESKKTVENQLMHKILTELNDVKEIIEKGFQVMKK